MPSKELIESKLTCVGKDGETRGLTQGPPFQKSCPTGHGPMGSQQGGLSQRVNDGELKALGPHVQGSVWVVRGRLSNLQLTTLFGTIMLHENLMGCKFAEWVHSVDHRAVLFDN